MGRVSKNNTTFSSNTREKKRFIFVYKITELSHIRKLKELRKLRSEPTLKSAIKTEVYFKMLTV